MNGRTRHAILGLLGAMFIVGAITTGYANAAEPRRVISLDGTWQVGEGKMTQTPAKFEHTVPVPGMIDMAKPAFEAVGKTATANVDGSQFAVPEPGKNGEKNSIDFREAFWYRCTFKVEGPVPAVALLKLNKAKYGVKVFVNGKEAGEHLPCFTPGYFDVKRLLKGDGAENELIIRVGAAPNVLPRGIIFGLDFEKKVYIPGIYDSVSLILSGTPHIVRVQAAPEVTTRTVHVVARLGNAGKMVAETTVRFKVREARSGKVAGTLESAKVTLQPGAEQDVDVRIPIENCHLWSPEDPFLYELVTETSTDKHETRFGMRDFHFDARTKQPMLNGKPYYLRGSNMCFFRFEEAENRGDKPWREEWVRRLFKKYKSMNWNSGRICIGFPPELWYRIADEEGVLVQDEYPIWYPFQLWPNQVTSTQLVTEFTEWMQERWNHPCVAIWDASNETTTHVTGIAIGEVRKLDLSNRPWDNSWNWTPVATDLYESHAYAAGFVQENNAYREPMPGDNESGPYGKGGILNYGGTLIPDESGGARPMIVNEYVWLWLNHDGTPTVITKDQWNLIMKMPNATPQERIYTWNRQIAQASEFLRSGRKLAGVHEFCFLSPDQHPTPDHFVDREKLTLEPNYERMVSEAFAPVGLSIDYWDPEYPAGRTIDALPVVLINDLYTDWQGPVTLSVKQGEKTVAKLTKEAKVAAVGRTVVTFKLPVPPAQGKYLLEAAIHGAGGRLVRSERDFTAVDPMNIDGLAVGKHTTASSNYPGNISQYAFDGDRRTKWMSGPEDPQWIAVDLGAPAKLSRAKIFWGREYAKAYTIDVSSDGKEWKTIYRQNFSPGGIEEFGLGSIEARYVRLSGLEQGARFGYSILEFKIFGEAVGGVTGEAKADGKEGDKKGVMNPNQELLEKTVKEKK